MSGVDEGLLSRATGWRNYLEAKLGFRNHWYPIRFSHEVAESSPVAAQVLGEKILLNRIEGRVYAIRDRCIHRGVPLSAKLECHTRHTVTCWYHGFTYRFDSGELVNIIGVPHSKLIGKRHIRTFPIREAQGVVFVFVGDENREPPPLVNDVPPGFLDDGVAVRGMYEVVDANWRLGAENGYDSAHIYLHRNAAIVNENDLMLPLSFQPEDYNSEYFVVVDEEDGPKGIFTRKEKSERPIFDGEVEGEIVVRGRSHGSHAIPKRSSLWLPCGLKVDPWPDPSTIQYEWYVPIDEDHHLYFRTLACAVANAEEEAAFEHAFKTKWRPLALEGFNGEDVFAREALQTFYEEDGAWLDEQLCEQDQKIIRWRKFASEKCRGVQTREHLRQHPPINP